MVFNSLSLSLKSISLHKKYAFVFLVSCFISINALCFKLRLCMSIHSLGNYVFIESPCFKLIEENLSMHITYLVKCLKDRFVKLVGLVGVGLHLSSSFICFMVLGIAFHSFHIKYINHFTCLHFGI